MLIKGAKITEKNFDRMELQYVPVLAYKNEKLFVFSYTENFFTKNPACSKSQI